ncbi:unnamed protein product [Blumeria hordei]|uniref:Uncharacterized protein n=1 Tax=Blumeria hordei TaxID=2867405 RepID=A0A383UIZ6_BLUHO|nr:unnamed protein product [Blumeria hordei]
MPERTGTHKLHKRSAYGSPHPKLLKKRKEEDATETRAKATTTPEAPLIKPGTTGRLKKRKSTASHKLANTFGSSPQINCSPIPVSVNSTDCATAYVLSSFDIFSARPTIKHVAKQTPLSCSASNIDDVEPERRQNIYSEEFQKFGSKIDNLADQLSAHELRELMDRDQKRKEKKKIAKIIETERRLAEERNNSSIGDPLSRQHDGAHSTTNDKDNGRLGELNHGTGAVIPRQKSFVRFQKVGERQSRETFSIKPESLNRGSTPIDRLITNTSQGDSARMSTSRLSKAISEPVNTRTSSRARNIPSQSSWVEKHSKRMSLCHILAQRKSTASTGPILPEKSVDATPELSTKPPQSWTSFFKIRSRNKRAPSPKTFFATSRASAPLETTNQFECSSKRSTPSIPRHTVSRFREDLPELPISPPDSRVQSLELKDAPIITRCSEQGEARVKDFQTRNEISMDIYRPQSSINRQSEILNGMHRVVDAPSPESNTLSQSLASIDSEGSWLSGGRASSRRNSRRAHQRSTNSSLSLNRGYQDFHGSTDEIRIADDDNHFRISSIDRESMQYSLAWNHDQNGTFSENTKWGAVGRRPNFVYRCASARRSKEGCLNEFEEEESIQQSSVNRIEKRLNSYPTHRTSELGLYRAVSLDMGQKQSQNWRAGNARFLDADNKGS